MGVPMILHYQNNEALEAEYFVKHGRGLNDPAPKESANQEDGFGRRIDDSTHPFQKVVEKAERDALLKGSVESVDPSWSEPIGVEKRATPLGKTVAEHLGITRYEDRMIDGQPWRFAFNGADEVVKSRRIYA